MPRLSKSRLTEYRQCPKRLWMQRHEPSLAVVDDGLAQRLAVGNQVGEVARRIYDPNATGITFDAQVQGYDEVLKASRDALCLRVPLFESGFEAGIEPPDQAAEKGSLIAFTDALLPAANGDGWHLIEVKSTASVKPYHLDDLAIQVHILTAAGVPLVSASVACIDNQWTYPGDENHEGLLRAEDHLALSLARRQEVNRWASESLAVISMDQPPAIPMGPQCHAPFACPFQMHCQSLQALGSSAAKPPVESPVEWLPGSGSRELKAWLEKPGIVSMDQVPDRLLNERQLRVKQATLSKAPMVDAAAAQKALSKLKWPIAFLDFEAVQFALPRWAGTRPFSQIPFQYSLHLLEPNGELTHREFLDLSGRDPRGALAAQLVADLAGHHGSVVAYSASFEAQVLRKLAMDFPKWAPELTAIDERLVDLLPITRQCYYHPAQQGSWSIKKVLPTLPGQVGYADLEHVADGQQAVLAYLEAIDAATSADRIQEIRTALLKYCRLDTQAMVDLLQFLRSL